jgi:hypothetical protein
LSRHLNSPFYSSYTSNNTNPLASHNTSKQTDTHQYNNSSYNHQYNLPYTNSNASGLYPFKFNSDHPHHHYYHSSPIYNHAHPYGSFNHANSSLPGSSLQNLPYYPNNGEATNSTAPLYRSGNHNLSSSNSPPSLATSTVSSSASLSPTSISSVSSGVHATNNAAHSSNNRSVGSSVPDTHGYNANSTDRYLLHQSVESSLSSSSPEVSLANQQPIGHTSGNQHFLSNTATPSSFETNRILSYMDYIMH